MTETVHRPRAVLRPRVRSTAVALLALTAALAFVVVSISYGFALEYGDTAAGVAQVAARSFLDWSIGIVLVVGFAGWAVMVARHSRGRRTMTIIAALAVAVTLVGVPAGAVLGVHRKFDRYPQVPACVAGFGSGPAVPVVRAAQTGFAELDHPGPFSGGGSSGIDGCSTQLMVRGTVDVPAAYRRTLVANGWRIATDQRDLITATKDGQEFEASLHDGAWWVWIGPEGLQPRPTQPGQVGPRR